MDSLNDKRVVPGQSGCDMLRDNYRLQRVLEYIDSNNIVCWPCTQATIPSLSPSLSEISDMDPSLNPTTTTKKSKNLRAVGGGAYRFALDSRRVAVDSTSLSSIAQPKFLEKLDANTTIPREVESSLFHAMAIRNTALNKTTFCLALPFFITEWLIGMPQLRFALSMQWNTEHLETSKEDTRTLSMPKPDLTIGFKWRSLSKSQRRPSVRPEYACPVAGDVETAFPFFALETKSNDSDQARFQNLHTSALMLRNLRLLYKECHQGTDDFDGKVHVITATMTRNELNVYGHYIGCDSSIIWYKHCLMCSWSLSGSKEDFYRARKGLEVLVNSIADVNRAWILPGLEKMKVASQYGIAT